VPFAGLVWEVDEFAGLNEGLIVAEVELSDPDQPVELPTWVGAEVTDDERFYNSNLALNPHSRWR
jgi:adenylate cyclase